MNIGIDIDGVILDTEYWFRAYGEIFDIERGGAGVVNPDELFFQWRLNWSDETFCKFKEKYGYDAERNAPLMPCVQMVLEKLKEMGHRLIVITARGKWGEKEIEITNETIEKYDLKFDKVYLNVNNKAEICKAENIDYMIDDAYTNIECVSDAGINCFYFRDVGRKKINRDNVIEVSSWGDIYRFFYNLNK